MDEKQVQRMIRNYSLLRGTLHEFFVPHEVICYLGQFQGPVIQLSLVFFRERSILTWDIVHNIRTTQDI